MIVIVSISKDGSTYEVINWIKKYNYSEEILRINVDVDIIKILKYDESNKEFLLEINDKTYNLFNCKSFWYRKGGSLISHKIVQVASRIHSISAALNNLAITENNTIDTFLYHFLEKHANLSIGKRANATPNKLIVLAMADRLGIKTPTSFLFTQKVDVINKLKECSLITKAASDGVYIFSDEYSYYSYTELIDEKNLEKLPNSFSPSLFQKNIDKSYEIRTFFLGENLYSMAILSQNSNKTKIDFRKYDQNVPNRNIPYFLPDDLGKKIRLLMRELELNTGSIDFVVDKKGIYYFLEVNPVGQFGMVSHPCNYNIEKKIALSLINSIFIYE